MIRCSLFPISLALLLLTGCGGGSGSSGGSDLGEPNDDILKAGVTKPGRTIEMKIDSNDDRDWYGIAVPGTGYIKTGVKDVPGDLDPEVRFARKQEWEDQKEDWMTGWNEIPKAIRIAEADTIYMAVQDKHQNASSSKSFPLRVQFIEEFDQQEPNDEVENAVSVEAGQPNETYIYPIGDRDRFKVKVDTAGYLRVASKKSPKGVDEEVRYGRVNEMDDLKRMTGWGETPFEVRVPEAGTYHLALQDKHNNGASQDPLKWKVEHLVEMDTTEPNSSTDQASAVSIPDTLAFAIYPEGDRDFLELSPEKGMKLLVKADAPDELDPEVRLWRKKEMKNKKVTGWKELPTKLDLKAGKTYYLAVQDKHNNSAKPKAFPVHLSRSKGK